MRPTAAQSRAEEVKAKMLGRYAEAPDSPARLVVGFDFVRSAAAGARRVDPAHTDHLLDELVRRLVRTGDELLQITVRGGRR